MRGGARLLKKENKKKQKESFVYLPLFPLKFKRVGVISILPFNHQINSQHISDTYTAVINIS